MAKLKITQIRSRNGATKRQIDTLASLGIRRMNHTIVLEENPVSKGMIDKVLHLIKVEEIE